MEGLIYMWPVLVAAVANMVIGGLWYGPVFGKYWMKLAGISVDNMKTMPLKPWQAVGIMFILSLVMAYVLSFFLKLLYSHTGILNVGSGLLVAFKLWVGLALPIVAGVFLWEGKSWKLWVLNAAYYLVALLVMGAIIAYF